MGAIKSLKAWARPLICPFDEILGYLPPRVSSYDIGCGTGYLLGRIAGTKQPTALGGVEVSGDLVQFAEKRIREISSSVPLQLGTYDGCNLPDVLSSYDYLWMVDVLHHIPSENQGPILGGLAKKMKSGAKLILKDIDASRRILCLANKFHDLLSSGEIGHELPRTSTEALLRESGLEILERGVKRMWVYPHYWFVCAKR
jgi:2-polyprenyl-3-methyl-5-hydroxy-6-metoxy-1,4-benzoquinol methylase